jgi:hypothetical protein
MALVFQAKKAWLAPDSWLLVIDLVTWSLDFDAQVLHIFVSV